LKTQQRLMNETAARLRAQLEADQSAKVVRAEVSAASLAELLLILEAGCELCLDLGLSANVGAATSALAQLLQYEGAGSRIA
jgi:hypothetical protein